MLNDSTFFKRHFHVSQLPSHHPQSRRCCVPPFSLLRISRRCCVPPYSLIWISRCCCVPPFSLLRIHSLVNSNWGQTTSSFLWEKFPVTVGGTGRTTHHSFPIRSPHESSYYRLHCFVALGTINTPVSVGLILLSAPQLDQHRSVTDLWTFRC